MAGATVVKGLQHVDQDIPRQVLAGDHPDLLLPGLHVAGMAQLACAIEEGQGMRQEALPLRRQHRCPARAPRLAVELHAQLGLQRHQAVAYPLLGDGQRIRGGADLPLARQLDEGGDLVGAEVRQAGHAPSYTENHHAFNN